MYNQVPVAMVPVCRLLWLGVSTWTDFFLPSLIFSLSSSVCGCTDLDHVKCNIR